MQLLIIFLSIFLIHGLDYDIDNQQICTHCPFKADFDHNCSRTRLIENVSVANTDQILYITIIFDSTLNLNTSLNITKSSLLDQQIYFTFFTVNQQYMSINNKTQIILNDASINSYLYDTYSEYFILTLELDFPSISNDTYCLLKNDTLLPSKNISRIYYLYTNETNLHLDLSITPYRISPLYNRFQSCYKIVTTLTKPAIIIIVIVCVLTFVTLVLISICLKKQLLQLYIILKNWLLHEHDQIAQVVIDGTSPT